MTPYTSLHKLDYSSEGTIIPTTPGPIHLRRVFISLHPKGWSRNIKFPLTIYNQAELRKEIDRRCSSTQSPRDRTHRPPRKKFYSNLRIIGCIDCYLLRSFSIEFLSWGIWSRLKMILNTHIVNYQNQKRLLSENNPNNDDLLDD